MHGEGAGMNEEKVRCWICGGEAGRARGRAKARGVVIKTRCWECGKTVWVWANEGRTDYSGRGGTGTVPKGALWVEGEE